MQATVSGASIQPGANFRFDGGEGAEGGLWVTEGGVQNRGRHSEGKHSMGTHGEMRSRRGDSRDDR